MHCSAVSQKSQTKVEKCRLSLGVVIVPDIQQENIVLRVTARKNWIFLTISISLEVAIFSPKWESKAELAEALGFNLYPSVSRWWYMNSSVILLEPENLKFVLLDF